MKPLNNVVKKFLIVALLSAVLITSFELLVPKKLNALTLRELSNQIASLSDEQEALVEEIITVEASIKTKANEIEQLTGRISIVENELEGLNHERKTLEKSIKEKKQLLEKRIIYSYKYSRNSVLKMIMAARDINEFISMLYLMRNIMKKDADLIESIRLEKESHDRIMRKSEEKKKELNQSRNLLEEEKKKLEAKRELDRQLLEKVKGEKAEVQQTLEAIRERIAKIQPEGIILAGEWRMVATAYYAGGGGLNGNGITATGLRARKGIIAVDPSVIRLGTKLYIEGYGEAIAADTGGWIKGNRVDLCFDTLEECYRYGRRKIYVYLME